MTTFRQAIARGVSFFRKHKLDREFGEELSAHIELATEEHLRRGLSAGEARRRAMIELGGIEPSRESHRDARGLSGIEGAWQDLRFAVRGLRRSPAFTVTAIATLAVGIGINATVFTVTDAVLFKGFPGVKDNDRLLYISNGGCCIAYPDFEDIREQARSFQAMRITHGIGKILSDGSGFPENLDVTEVSADTFRAVGVRPIAGRDFTAADQGPGAAPVALLNYGFWGRRYGNDRNIVGRTVRMNGALTTIIGIMPEGFSFPQKTDMWVPLVETASVQNRGNTDTWFAFGRLADGVAFQNARLEVQSIIQRLETEYPVTDPRFHLVVQTFPQFFIGANAAKLYGSMWGAVGFVLLIACANLANLMLARAMGRSREISIRIALGAGRWRIIRQVLIESTMLSGLGGLAGWWIAKWGVRIYAHAIAAKESWLIIDYTMDHRVVGCLIAISIGTGVLFGLAPALRLSRFDVNPSLKDGARGTTRGARGTRLSALLVTGELALAVALLAGAGVLIRSFLKINNANTGVNTANVLAGSINLMPARYARPEQRISFFDRLETRLSAIPGVESVGMAEALPSWNLRETPYELAAPQAAVDSNFRRPKIPLMKISPGYFQTLQAAIHSGRDFNNTDTALSPPVAIVNQKFADKFWPGEDPLGKRIRLFNGTEPQAWRTVVGVVSDIVQNDMTRQTFTPLVYLPYRQEPGAGMWLFARTRVPPATRANAFRRELMALDSGQPVYGPFPLAQHLEMYWDSQFYGTLFLIFAAVALLLASVGLYTVVAHSVAQRTQEIGLRMAVGATAFDVLRLVFRQAMLPLTSGLTLGLACAVGVNRLLVSELVNVSPSDPVTFLIASAILFIAAALGCFIPALRAARVDPVLTLRHP